MENCSRCEQLPERLTGEGHILSSPLEHTLAKMKDVFEEHDHPFSVRDDELFPSRLSAEGLRTFADRIR